MTRISFDTHELDLDLIHAFLSGSYWAAGIPRHTVERAITGSLCVGAYAPDEGGKDEQIGFARVITDKATFAYLADVFVLPAHRGQGVARAMLTALHDHPELQGLRRWALFTRDMQPVYAKLGWTPYPHPERLMVRDDPDIYQR
ncbi:GNAT family N-acetyltransferase [Sphingomonas sp. LB-2]|uniref:GNAT family N-acetyltransferase n=1 Tax=Sphingomonas caeni TaxID=2984949 RepID=UPI00222EE537|nr:GNAT family N-acetyltransferase [Sphingomonas caeni]MCW3846876.1 GNAT family N-acetyltransferase [Sphingomonas caeni]